MALIVQKYGGSSAADPAKIRKIARRAIAAKDKGNKVVVVISAMGDATDDLLELAREVADHPDERELDSLLSTGEIVSSTLLAMAIKSLGQRAISLSGSQAGIQTDDTHNQARISSITPERILRELEKDCIVVVAGFQGVTNGMDVTTLGRGGSDTTAVALAVSLKADTCQIFTDVEGVFTADPRICPKARKLDRISYEEMLELASLGAKVLQIRSVALAMRFNTNLCVRSSFNEKPGTLIIPEDKDMESILVAAVALCFVFAVSGDRAAEESGTGSGESAVMAAARAVCKTILDHWWVVPLALAPFWIIHFLYAEWRFLKHVYHVVLLGIGVGFLVLYFQLDQQVLAFLR